MRSTRRHEACRRPDAPRSVLGRACLVPMLGLLVASCDGRSSPTTPTSVPTSTTIAPTPSPSPPMSGPPPDCRALQCSIPGAIDGHGTQTYRFEVTAAGRIYLRLRLLDQYGGGLAVYFCPRATCHNQGFGDVPVLDMADHELRVGDVASVYLENTEPQSTSFVLDFELDVNGSPPICVPSLRTPAPGAVFDNGRTDRRDPIVWDFGWNECPGATDYDIEAASAGASIAIPVARGVAGSSSRYVSCGHIADFIRLGWSWRVRAHSGARFGEWSPAWPFDVERADSDPIAPQCP